MDPLALVLGLLLLGAALILVVKPLRVKSRSALGVAGAGIRPGEAHKAALAALRDLDFDFRTGKLSAEDYPALRAGLVAKAAESMQVEAAEDDRIETMIRARIIAPAHGKPCPKCGKHVEADVRFCPHCGIALGNACLSCGGVIQAEDAFCSSCGVKLGNPDRVAA